MYAGWSDEKVGRDCLFNFVKYGGYLKLDRISCCTYCFHRGELSVLSVHSPSFE